jgi:hypothetical protein
MDKQGCRPSCLRATPSGSIRHTEPEAFFSIKSRL